MNNTTNRRILMGVCMSLTMFALLGATAIAQTSRTERAPGATTSTTTQVHATVVKVEGSTVLLKYANGDMKQVEVPADRTAVVDGKEITVKDLKEGTSLTATIVTQTTPVVERTISNLSGKVWYVNGPNVILTMPDGKNRQFKVKPDVKFKVGGQNATVFDLRPGMNVSVEKIVEEPKTEVATNQKITGTAPTPQTVAIAEAPIPMPAPAPREPVVARPAEPAPAPVETAKAAPVKLPKTASPVPLFGLFGLLCTGASLGLRTFRRLQ